MIRRVIPLFFLAIILLNAADNPQISALRAADDERVSATIAADRVRLSAIFSDDLRYAHSTGSIDTKETFISMVISGRSKYESIHFEERIFTIPAPGIGLVTGRASFKVSNINRGGTNNVLGFLAVWRHENGQWRFLAWQSCIMPADVTPPSPTLR